MTRRSFVRASVLLTFLVVVLQSVWALAMPAFRGPDEPHHVNSIMRIASGNGWPEPGDAMIDTKMIEAGREAGIITPGANDFTSKNRTRLFHGSPINQYFADTLVEPHERRSSIYPIEVAAEGALEVDQMTQHPPLYYAGGALVVKALDLEDAPWDRLLQVLRLYGIILTIPVVPSFIYTARRLGASRRWALLAGLIPLSIPQLFGTSGVVTNDTFAIGAGALVMAAIAKAGTERISPKTVALVGGSLGLALWSKGLLLALGLPLVLIFMLAKNETWKTKITATLVAGVSALAIGWWWILNIVRYGVIQPAGYHRDPPLDWDPAMAEFSHFFTIAFRTFTNSFFSSFGWLEGTFPRIVTYVLFTVLVIAVLWSLIRAGRTRTTYLILLSPFIGLVILLYLQGWSNYLSTSVVAGVQGRYLYPCIVAFAGIVLGLRYFGRWGYRLTALYTVGVGVFGFLWLMRSSYPGETWANLDRFAYVAGISVPVLVVVLTIYVLVNLAILTLAFLWARHAHEPDPFDGKVATLEERGVDDRGEGMTASPSYAPALGHSGHRENTQFNEVAPVAGSPSQGRL